MGLIGEFERHSATIAMFPFRTDIWRGNAAYMQKYILDLVDLISRYEPVLLFCSKPYLSKVGIVNKNVTVITSEYDDIWARDIGPSFVINEGVIECIDWEFNAWGGKEEGSYYPWDADDQFAALVARFLKLPHKRIPVVIEGGGIITDGVGTIFTTKSVLLNKNRNPSYTEKSMEKVILSATHDQRIIWLNEGLAQDETNGHIDNIMSCVSNDELCLAWTDDKHNPHYNVVREAYSVLSSISNLQGKKYKIHLIPLPPMQYMNQIESDGLTTNPDAILRSDGDLLPASYLNYYVINGAVLIPSFGCNTDDSVLQIFKEIFPDRDVIQVYSREPLLGGGGIHCLLHEIPFLGEGLDGQIHTEQ